MSLIFEYLEHFNNFLWGYIGTALILSIGLIMSFSAKGMQITQFPKVCKLFWKLLNTPTGCERGTSPIRAFFASLGGCIGIGNLATVALAVKIGGPGVLVWIWVTAFLGMVLKYAEVYLGVKYRVKNTHDSYDGGPMYFIPKAFPKYAPLLVSLMAICMCLYGVEIYMFNVISTSISHNWNLDLNWVTVVILLLVLSIVAGGVSRLGAISAVVLPVFVLIFVCMTAYVLILNYQIIPSMFMTIVKSAFTGHAVVGGFAGSTIILAMAKGFSSACYSGDVGIGYASLIHSETQIQKPEEQAALSIFGIYLDTLVVCTCVVLLLLATGVWTEGHDSAMLVQAALSQYFPHMEIFMPIFFFILGFSTVTAYLIAGLKSAEYLMPTHGKKVYYVYAIFMFLLFAQVESLYAMTIMSIAGGLLMLINIPAIFKLRKEITFGI